MTDLIYLNEINYANCFCCSTLWQLKGEVKNDHKLVGVEFGVAYGGGLQVAGRIWKSCGGVIHGFDTFTGHPKHLAKNPNSMEAICLDAPYAAYGTDRLSYDYQRKVLDEEGLSNVILHKGLIDEHSMDDIDHLDYCFLDIDFPVSMRLSWNLVRNRIRSKGILCLHDCIPKNHIVGLHELYQEILATGEYSVMGEYLDSYLCVLRKN